jgi:hypothetical protein
LPKTPASLSLFRCRPYHAGTATTRGGGTSGSGSVPPPCDGSRDLYAPL